MSLVPKLGSILIDKSSIYTKKVSPGGVEQDSINHIGSIYSVCDDCEEKISRIKVGSRVMYNGNLGTIVNDENGKELLLLSISNILCYINEESSSMAVDKQL